jgi:hypothetical protein
MTDITLVKRTDLQLNDAQRATLRLALFEMIDGLGEADQKSWRRFWNWITRAGTGEMVVIKTILKRNSKFHRKFFALLNVGYEAWDPGRKHKTYKGVPVAKNFEQFREDVTILAGYFEQTFGISGEMKLKARSISFAKMEQPEFEALYSAVADVLLEHVLVSYSNRAALDDVVNRVMEFL